MQKFIPLFILAASFLTIPALAAVTPLSLGIAPPVQFPSAEFTVTGLRTSLLWGRHRDLYGIDIGGLGNITEQTFTGIGISGLFNYTQGTTAVLGLQFAGLTNINTNKTSVYGIQAALGMNLNTAASSLAGIQLAVANVSPFTDVYGMQLGIYNKAQEVYGLQIGLVNVASDLHGVQIGLLNFNQKGLFVVAPIINVGF
jgi:hypothetical protein